MSGSASSSSTRPPSSCSLSQRRLIGIELPHLLEHISLDLQRLKQCLSSGQGFTDSEVTLVVEGNPDWWR